MYESGSLRERFNVRNLLSPGNGERQLKFYGESAWKAGVVLLHLPHSDHVLPRNVCPVPAADDP